MSATLRDGIPVAAQDAATQRALIGVEKKNYIINGAMMISQENGTTAGTTTLYYPVDQFLVNNNTAATFTIAQVASQTPGGSPNRIRFTATSTTAPAGNTFCVLQQRLEGFRTSDLNFGLSNAKTITIQFGCKGPAGTYGVSIYNGAANRAYAGQIVIAAGEANTDVVKSVTVAGDITGTWAKDNTLGMYVSVVMQSSGTYQIAPNAWTVPTGFFTNAQTNFFTNGNVFELFDVGLYEGGVAPAFIVPDYQKELAECQRYFQIFAPGTSAFLGVGGNQTATQTFILWTFPVPMRATPSGSYSAVADWNVRNFTDNSNHVVTSSASGFNNSPLQACANSTVGSGLTAGGVSSLIPAVGTGSISMNARL